MTLQRSRRARGFTLVDTLIACAVTGVLATVALPSYRGQLVKSRRADAVAALTRVQAAQERLRADQGLYSDRFETLRTGQRSEQGWYALAVELDGADGYRATATAVDAQADDTECPRLALVVANGFATIAPTARCWNR
jgi:type IV pilus assembly protein PilE